jgi:adenylate cyclase
MLINYAGGYESFPYYPFYKVLNGQIPLEKFRGKCVLVGGTAAALFDSRSTPFSPFFPGVEIHANTVSNILMGNYLRPWPAYVTLFLIILFAMLPGLVLNRFSPFYAGVITLAVLTGYFFLTYFLFVSKFVYAEFVAPAFGFALSYVGVLFYRFMTEEKEKRKMKKTFGQLVNPRVLEKMLNDPSYQKVGGHKELLTVLFSDIRGFTTITETLPPEQLVPHLNEYLGKMVEVVFRHDGTLDKFIGDAVMAIFGAPVPQNDHAKRAVLCALDMMDELAKLQEKWRAEGKPVFDIGLGINTGEMTVGFMGSQEKKEYTVIGDNVNLASRLEGLNKEYKTHIIISDSTYQQVKDIIEARSLGSVMVKGKTKTVDIYEVVGKKKI